MSLWLETRDTKGSLVGRYRFKNGVVEMLSSVEVNGDGSTSAPVYTVQQIIKLAKLSANLPLEQRDYALRISSDD